MVWSKGAFEYNSDNSFHALSLPIAFCSLLCVDWLWLELIGAKMSVSVLNMPAALLKVHFNAGGRNSSGHGHSPSFCQGFYLYGCDIMYQPGAPLLSFFWSAWPWESTRQTFLLAYIFLQNAIHKCVPASRFQFFHSLNGDFGEWTSGLVMDSQFSIWNEWFKIWCVWAVCYLCLIKHPIIYKHRLVKPRPQITVLFALTSTIMHSFTFFDTCQLICSVSELLIALSPVHKIPNHLWTLCPLFVAVCVKCLTACKTKTCQRRKEPQAHYCGAASGVWHYNCPASDPNK